MKLTELSVLYGLVGMGCALVVLLRPAEQRGRLVDAVLLLGLWPLYGPFVVARWQGRDEGVTGREAAFLAALRRAGGTPLAALLPDQDTVLALGRRLRVAAGKVVEIDALLGQPGFSESNALERRRQLEQRGATTCALSTATMRIQNIRRLRQLRDRFARELDEVGELLQQLHTQAEVVRFAGTPDAGTRELVDELVSRVEGLDRMLDDDPDPLWPIGDYAEPPAKPEQATAGASLPETPHPLGPLSPTP